MNEMTPSPTAALAALLPQPPESAALDTLVSTLRERHGPSVNAILLYGSCLRSGDLFDGLVDLYLVTDRYRDFYPGRLKALANWLLPPNVFYIELPVNDRTVRAKYAVLSNRDLRRGTTRWFHSYLWGRFTQPTAIAWGRDEPARQAVLECFAGAIRTFLARTLPRLPASGSVQELWQQGLQLSYGAELRAEQPGRAGELTEAGAAYYRETTRLLAGSLRHDLSVEARADGSLRYRAVIPATLRLRSRLAWPLRRVQGKILSVLRLLKALFTFEGGLDYIAWKLERHSGQRVEVPDRVRRWPLIFVWGLFWRLWRRGIFR
jgi:hypothetical protein